MTDYIKLLTAIAPKGKHIEGVAQAMKDLVPYGISTQLRLAHFVAQAAHESDGFNTLTEYGKTSYFSKYDGRDDLGNTQKGDGAKFRGRGIFQITGRANYSEMSRKLGVDLIANPELLASDYDLATKSAGEFWTSRNLNKFADLDDIMKITKRINGGYNHLEERKGYLAKAKKALGIP